MAVQTPVHVSILQKILTYVDIAAQLGRAIPESHVSRISALIDVLITDLYPVIVPQQTPQQPPAVPPAAPVPSTPPATTTPQDVPTTTTADIPHNNSGAD